VAPQSWMCLLIITPWIMFAIRNETGLSRGLKTPAIPHNVHTFTPFSSMKQPDVLKKPKNKDKIARTVNTAIF
jgi:hypothetical protein